MKQFGAALIFAAGLAAAWAVAVPSAGGAGAVRILQIHPTFVVSGPSSSKAIARVNVQRIPPGYALRITPRPSAISRGRISAMITFRPALARGQITVVVTRARVAQLAWFGWSQQIMVTTQGPVLGQQLCVTLSGQLHELPCPRPAAPPPVSVSAPAVTASPPTTTTASAPPPPPPPPTPTPTPTPTSGGGPPPDSSAPSVPGGLSASASASAATLSWSASTDNVGVAGYKVFLNGSQVGTTGSTSYGFSSLTCGMQYTLGVAAYDAAGNTSAAATTTATTTKCADTTPPAVPTGLAQIDNSLTAVRVAWNNSTDNVGVAGYDLYLNGALAVTGATSSYVIGGLSCSQSYTVSVDAYDAAGNHSGQASITASTQPCPPPPPTVTASKGPQHNVGGCTSSACAYLTVSWANFSSGSHTVQCWGDYGGASAFYSYSVSGSSGSSNVCVFGYPGYHAWAVVDGVTSNQVTW